MLAPNQTLLLHDYFTRDRDLWLLCEKYDCDHDQMLAIIGAITPYLPGKGLDYNAILNQDPIACDHLVLHCQRSIGQLDALYDRLISLFDSSSSHDLQINKRTTVNIPPDWAKPSFSDGEFHWDTSKGSEKIETTTLENKQRFRILDSAMKCLERGLKMQITLTQRKEKLSKEQLNQEKPKNPSPRRPQAQTPTSGLSGLSGMQPYKGMTGYNLDELENPSPNPDLPASSNQDPVSRDATRSAHPQSNVTATNKMAHNKGRREEEPGTSNLSATSASPPETSPSGPEQSTIPKIPHPQYSPREADSDRQTFIPLGMDNGLEDGPMEEFIYPIFAKPLGEDEKVHYFPPFAEASPEDAAEIDAYLKSLPAEVTAENNIGSYFNDYLLAPILRTTQSEAEHTIHHRRLKRTAARQAAERSAQIAPENDFPLQPATNVALAIDEPLYHQRE